MMSHETRRCLERDGYRVLLSVDAARVQLVTRRGTDLRAAFPEIVAGAAQLAYGTAADGEIRHGAALCIVCAVSPARHCRGQHDRTVVAMRLCVATPQPHGHNEVGFRAARSPPCERWKIMC